MNLNNFNINSDEVVDVKIKTRISDNQLQTEKVWVTLLHNGFEKIWIPLVDENDNHIEWVDKVKLRDGRTISGATIAKQLAARFFKGSWGVSFCSQKELGNSVQDNF